MRPVLVAALLLATALVLLAVFFGGEPQLAPAKGAAENAAARQSRGPTVAGATGHEEGSAAGPSTAERTAVEGTLRGRVVWTDGEAAAGASIWCAPSRQGRVERVETIADAEGGFLVADLPAGSYRVWIKHRRAIEDRRMEVAVRAGETRELRVPLERGLALAGHVVLVAGNERRPARRGWTVRAFPARGTSRITRIGEDGAFRFDALPAGVYEIVLWNRSWRSPTPVRASAGQHDVLLEVVRGRAVFTGRVTHPDGRPLQVFHLEVLDEGSLRPYARTSRKCGKGTYRTPALPAGSYRLHFLAGGRQPREVHAVLPEAGEVQVDVVLPELHAVRGVVLDASGRPLAGAHVQVLGEPPAQLAMDELGLERMFQGVGGYTPGVFGNTDADGRFALPPQERASWVLVRDMDHATRLLPVPDPPGRPLEIRMARGVEVRGRVVDEQDRPVPGAQVLLLPGGEPFDPRMQDEESDGGGRFSFASVGPGSWSVFVMRDREVLPGTYAGVDLADRFFQVADTDVDLGDLR